VSCKDLCGFLVVMPQESLKFSETHVGFIQSLYLDASPKGFNGHWLRSCSLKNTVLFIQKYIIRLISLPNKVQKIIIAEKLLGEFTVRMFGKNLPPEAAPQQRLADFMIIMTPDLLSDTYFYIRKCPF
jgi:hypothetical protein